MIKLNDYFHLGKRATKGSMSLSGKLEAIVGNYFVSGEGNPDETIYTIYYDPTIDSYYVIKESYQYELHLFRGRSTR